MIIFYTIFEDFDRETKPFVNIQSKNEAEKLLKKLNEHPNRMNSYRMKQNFIYKDWDDYCDNNPDAIRK